MIKTNCDHLYVHVSPTGVKYCEVCRAYICNYHYDPDKRVHTWYYSERQMREIYND